MTLIACGFKIKNGRTYDVSIDSDDLDDLSYHYFKKAQSLGIQSVARGILSGRVTGEYIENHPEKYADLID